VSRREVFGKAAGVGSGGNSNGSSRKPSFEDMLRGDGPVVRPAAPAGASRTPNRSSSPGSRTSVPPGQSTAALLQVLNPKSSTLNPSLPPTSGLAAVFETLQPAASPSLEAGRRCGPTQARALLTGLRARVPGRGTRLAPGCCTPPSALPLRGVQTIPACRAACLHPRALAHMPSLRRHPPHPAPDAPLFISTAVALPQSQHSRRWRDSRGASSWGGALAPDGAHNLTGASPDACPAPL
jgi:hypothetical protein